MNFGGAKGRLLSGQAEDLAEAEFGPHALFEMARRDISEDEVRRVLASPGRREQVRPGRLVLSILQGDPRRSYVLRVFVDVDRAPPAVVTVYRSSKIQKYWSQQ